MAPKLLTCKRRKEVEKHGGVTDRMSSLPDSVLCHILSFLPTKTSVTTMTLVSRRWRHLWQHLQAFDFDQDSFKTVQESKRFKKFALFVNAVLAFRKFRDIRNFQLHCDIQNSNHRCDCADMWIRAAINPNLEQLSLSIFDCDWRLNLPHSLLNCNNLVSLSLLGAIEMNVQGFKLHFPSLKLLKLDFSIVDSEFLLLSACPILETLEHVCFVPEYWTIHPVPPSSQRLNFNDGTFSWTCLEVDCFPNETFGIIGNFQSMVEAFMDFFPSQISESVDPNSILYRLQTSSNGLDIQLRHSTSKEEQPPLRTWDPKSTTVPKGLKFHLGYIHIEGYQGFEDELTFVEYILHNGHMLKTMLISFDTSMDLTNKYCSLKRLCDIPRRSRRCKLKCDPAVSS
ncbi:F-box/LRR-repeat protein At3g59190-like isoform X2 [Vicia villosa]|uniref:F-box/LRR-repeat protein At3g59190-like isoform X2 n=1 Tax=Vicia villosa TaxID=3911 RepID=UPI00273BA710|nr:F-box/LRR-repeat protein At3g59190-like isoform X2 [Vicia villosa]